MSPKKQLGQHFLTDQGAIGRATEALGLDLTNLPLVEIGPGRGAWTRELLKHRDSLVAIERDPDLIPYLEQTFPSGLQIIHADVMTIDWDELRQTTLKSDHFLLASNLPYNISKPICGTLVSLWPHMKVAVLMFQKEVADRLIAKPGQPDYGALSIWTQLHYDIKKLFNLKPGAFHPPPKVHSSVTHWQPKEEAPEGSAREQLSQWLRIAFHAPRKTLNNNLRRALSQSDLNALPPKWLSGRPGQLSPDEFFELSQRLGSPE